MHGILYHPPATTPVSLPGRREAAAGGGGRGGGEGGGEGEGGDVFGTGDMVHRQNADDSYGGDDSFALPAGQAGSRGRKKRRRWLQHSVELAAAGLMPPKQNRTGYNFFFGEWRAKLKAQHPHEADREISRMIGQRWAAMGLEERQVSTTHSVLSAPLLSALLALNVLLTSVGIEVVGMELNVPQNGSVYSADTPVK